MLNKFPSEGANVKLCNESSTCCVSHPWSPLFFSFSLVLSSFCLSFVCLDFSLFGRLLRRTCRSFFLCSSSPPCPEEPKEKTDNETASCRAAAGAGQLCVKQPNKIERSCFQYETRFFFFTTTTTNKKEIIEINKILSFLSFK